MSFESLACRLAGGFACPIDDEALREAIQKSLPEVELGELDAIKELPGLVAAAAETLRKAWRSGIDLQARAGDHPRIASIAKLEEAVLGRLPSAMMRPSDLVSKGMERLHHVKTIFGPIRVVGPTGLVGPVGLLGTGDLSVVVGRVVGHASLVRAGHQW